MKKRRFGAEGEDEGLVIMWQGGFEGKDWSAASYMGLEGRSGVRRGSLMPEIENTIENEMNEKLGLVKKEQIRRRFFKKPVIL